MNLRILAVLALTFPACTGGSLTQGTTGPVTWRIRGNPPGAACPSGGMVRLFDQTNKLFKARCSEGTVQIPLESLNDNLSAELANGADTVLSATSVTMTSEGAEVDFPDQEDKVAVLNMQFSCADAGCGRTGTLRLHIDHCATGNVKRRLEQPNVTLSGPPTMLWLTDMTPGRHCLFGYLDVNNNKKRDSGDSAMSVGAAFTVSVPSVVQVNLTVDQQVP